MIFESRLAEIDRRIDEDRRSLEMVKDVRFTGIGGLVFNPLLALAKARRSIGIKIMEKDKESTIRSKDRLDRLDARLVASRTAQWERLHYALDRLDAKRTGNNITVTATPSVETPPTPIAAEQPVVVEPIDNQAAEQIAHALLTPQSSHEQ